MNRKLHNLLPALVACGALVLVALIAAAPHAPRTPELGAAAVLATAIEAAAEAESDDARPRAARRAFALPYFSFSRG